MDSTRSYPAVCDGANAERFSRTGSCAPAQTIICWNEAHATLLATKWYDHKKLAELGEMEGLVYKKGPFSATEEQSMKAAIERYRVEHALTEGDIHKLIFTKQKGGTFWRDVARSVPMRPIKNVFIHVRRVWEPVAKQGPWSGREDNDLETAVRELGHTWDAISKRLGRSAGNCRDRYRNHLVHRTERKRGAWSPQEVQQLTAIVRSMISEEGGIASGVSWAKVAALMGHKRNGQQCRNKWVQSLHGRDEHSRLDWNTTDTFIFMHKVTSLSVLDETEITWSKFPDPGWNRWSAYQLQRKWRSLKRSIPGHENMTPQEIAHTVLQQATPASSF